MLLKHPKRIWAHRFWPKCLLGLLFFNHRVAYCRVRTPCTTTPGEALIALISLPSPMITMFQVPSESCADTVQSQLSVYGPESVTGITSAPYLKPDDRVAAACTSN